MSRGPAGLPAITPLDGWIGELTGGPIPLDRDRLEAWQLARLNETLAWARERTPFHRDRLPPDPLGRLTDLAGLPLTTTRDLADRPFDHLCVSQGEIARVVTLSTSGTTGPAKRMFFTAEDLERTVDFFHVGMSPLVPPGGRLLVLMPGARQGSVGELLGRAMARLGAAWVCLAPGGLVDDPAVAVEQAATFGATCLVGLPSHVLALARQAALSGRLGALAVSHALLSGDPAPDWLVRDIENLLGCEVWRHYGLTETGLGGAVECSAHAGLHLREADLLAEVVDPGGRPLLAGQEGELVLTTLSRRGMPLLRYRTGDLARLLPGPCPCGSSCVRLLPSGRRMGEGVALPGGGRLCIAEVDAAVLSRPGVVACHAALRQERECAFLRLDVACPGMTGQAWNRLADGIREDVLTLAGVQGSGLGVETRPAAAADCLRATPAKRRIAVERTGEGDGPSPHSEQLL